MRAIWLFIFLLIVNQIKAAEPIHPYVSYDFNETRRSESDHRECLTQIFLTADDYVGYRYREDVYGSTAATVTAIKFSNDYRRKATPDEQNKLVKALLAAEVFKFVDDLRPSETDYFSYFDVRINAQEKRTVFYSQPNSPARKAIHSIMLEFAHQMGVDRPADLTKATMVTEGDHEAAQSVKFFDLLAQPNKYDGKRVSVVGFYHGEFEGSSFSVDQVASQKRDYKQSIWRGGMSTFADASNFRNENDSWQRIEGIFLRGPGGHMGLWPGEITRMTRIESVSKPE